MEQTPWQGSPGRRAAQYWFIDGLPELIFGVAMVSLAAVTIAYRTLDLDWLKSFAIAVYVLFLVLFIWDRRIIGWESSPMRSVPIHGA